MNRFTYKWEAVLGCWVFLFTVIGGVLVFSAWIGTIESSTHEALWDAFRFSNYGTLILYIALVVFYPIIKEKDETNKAFERLKGR